MAVGGHPIATRLGMMFNVFLRPILQHLCKTPLKPLFLGSGANLGRSMGWTKMGCVSATPGAADE